MAVDEFKNLGFTEEGAAVGDQAKHKGLSRLEELRRENEELKKRHSKA